MLLSRALMVQLCHNDDELSPRNLSPRESRSAGVMACGDHGAKHFWGNGKAVSKEKPGHRIS